MASVSIEVSIDGAPPQTHVFDRSPVRLGRNERNDLPLAHSSVSGWHAMIRFDDTQANVVDLGSTNGTYVGGERLHANAPLAIAAPVELTIDRVQLRVSFRAGGAAVKASPNPVSASSPAAASHPPTAHPSPSRAPAAQRSEVSRPDGGARPGPTIGGPRTLEQLAARLLPPQHQPHGADEHAAFASKVVATFEVLAESFLHLQRQLDQLEDELGIPLLRDRGPLQQADDPAELLAYLLDFRPEDNGRAKALSNSLTQLMMHQVALFNAVLAGARAALRPIDPDVVEQTATGRWPTPAHARWQAYRARFAELVNDASFVSAVFGDTFRDVYQRRGE